MTKRQPEAGKTEAGKPEELKKNEEGKEGKEMAQKSVSKPGRTYDKNHHNATYHQSRVGECRF